MKKLSFTWLGHSTFIFDTPGGKRLIVDPWISSNPTTPNSMKHVGALDLMLITHGHADPTTDAVSIARSSGARVVAPYETAVWLQKKGLQNVTGLSLGGPIVRGTFYFSNVEQRALDQTGLVTIPRDTVDVINARLSAVGYPGSSVSTGLYANPVDMTTVMLECRTGLRHLDCRFQAVHRTWRTARTPSNPFCIACSERTVMEERETTWEP